MATEIHRAHKWLASQILRLSIVVAFFIHIIALLITNITRFLLLISDHYLNIDILAAFSVSS